MMLKELVVAHGARLDYWVWLQLAVCTVDSGLEGGSVQASCSQLSDGTAAHFFYLLDLEPIDITSFCKLHCHCVDIVQKFICLFL